MSAYFIFDVREVHDPGQLTEYVSQVTDTVESFGGRYVVRGGDFDVVEGDWKPVLLVLIEFPDVDTATSWYESPAYRPLRELRHGASTADAVLVAGLDPSDHPTEPT
jgi:uncharacterized protein (DUF1330 family)